MDERQWGLMGTERDRGPTWMELTMVLRANRVAQSRTVDWLSNAPWVSISTTATCTNKDPLQLPLT